MMDHCRGWAVMQLPESFRPLFYRPVVVKENGSQRTIMEKITPTLNMAVNGDSSKRSLL